MATSWQASDSRGVHWIIGHASRTLVKQGRKDALGLLGYPQEIRITAPILRVQTPVVHLGENLVFDFDICSEADAPQNLMIDFVIHHVKANGRRTPKVLKITQKLLAPHQRVNLTKKHPMRAINTRVYYPGIFRHARN